MQAGNAGVYGCPKGGENSIHAWQFDDTGIATCRRCDLELSAEDSADLRRTDELFIRALNRERGGS